MSYDNMLMKILVGKAVGTQQGLSDQEAIQTAALGALLPFRGLTSVLLIDLVLARRKAAGQTQSSGGTSAGGGSTGGTLAQMPLVKGRTLAEAQTLLAAAQLRFQRQDVLGNDDKDCVVSQFPDAGQLVPAGTQVILGVSLGITVPDVTKQSFDAASRLLDSIGLCAVRLDETSSAPQDVVISQSPAPPQTASRGDTVTLGVSIGQNVRVANVQGLGKELAASLLLAQGLVPDPPTAQNSDEVPKDSIISQAPAAFSLVPPGTHATLKFSTGVEDEASENELPDFTGVGVDVVRKQLDRMGLSLICKADISADIAPLLAIRQSPPAGTPIAAVPSAGVTVYFSSGRDGKSEPCVSFDSGHSGQDTTVRRAPGRSTTPTGGTSSPAAASGG